jgi:RNA polymerase sigma factor (sigma-70 family)
VPGNFYHINMLASPDKLFMQKSHAPAEISWDFQSAVGALAATAASELPDHLLMTLLAAAADRETVNRLFQEVFDRYSERVGRWCYRITRNRDRSLDLTQEVFLNAFRSRHTFRGESRLSTWLYAITRNHCLNTLKKWKTEPDDNVLASPHLLLRRKSTDDAHVAIEQAQSYQRVFRYISAILTPLEVRIITLHYVHEFTLSAITRHLMLSNRSGAKAYIVSARRKFSALFQYPEQYKNKLRADAGETSKRTAAA